MTDHTAAHELELYATNVEGFYMPVYKTLSRKYQKGIFSLDLAIKAIDRYCLTPAAKQYKFEHGSMTDRWYKMFPKCVRLEAAETIALQMVTEFKLGNF